MYVSRHIIFGFIFSLALWLLFPQIELIGFLLIWSSSVLIDFDHYLLYISRKKDWSLRKAYNWFIMLEKKILSLPRKQRNKYYVGIVLLHSIEILLILLFLGILISNHFFFIFIGFAFHMLLDVIEESKVHDRLDKISGIYDFFKFKKLRLFR